MQCPKLDRIMLSVSEWGLGLCESLLGPATLSAYRRNHHCHASAGSGGPSVCLQGTTRKHPATPVHKGLPQSGRFCCLVLRMHGLWCPHPCMESTCKVRAPTLICCSHLLRSRNEVAATRYSPPDFLVGMCLQCFATRTCGTCPIALFSRLRAVGPC